MKRSDLDKFTQLWAGMAEMYGKTVSDAAIAMAFSALEKYDLIDIRRALSAHAVDPVRGQFPAKPADLVLHMDGDPESRSLQAWSNVEKSIGRVGPHQSVVFDDPAVMASIDDMGGWIELCGITDEELPYKRQEFVKRYKGYLNRPPQSHPAKLIGSDEAYNMQHFPDYVSSPILIGNPQLALEVMKTGGEKKTQSIRLDQHLNQMKLLSLPEKTQATNDE